MLVSRAKLLKEIALFNKILKEKGLSLQNRKTICLTASKGIPSTECTTEQLKTVLLALQEAWAGIRAREIFNPRKR